MSDKGQIRPYHAKEVASGQEAADAVADVLKHAADRTEAAKKRVGPKSQPKWMLPLGLNLGLLAAYLLVAQPQWVEVSPTRPPPVERQIANLRIAMWAHGIVRIGTFLDREGRLPASLEEAGGAPLVGLVDYRIRDDGSYVLTGTIGNVVISYDSATQTAEEFTGPITLPG